jgi:hypothetical protein
MKSWKQRIRAAIGMALTWGALWSGAGVLLARVPGFYSDLPFALLFAPLGFATGLIFSGVLAALERHRRFARLPLWWFSACGAASGLLLTGAFVINAALRGESAWREFLVFGPALATASAACAAGSLAFARRTERKRL